MSTNLKTQIITAPKNLMMNLYMLLKKHRKAYLLILPSLAFVAMIIITPLIKGIIVSLTTDIEGKTLYAGIKNYKEILTDSKVYWAIARTFIWAIGTVAVTYILGLLLAILLNQNIRGRAFFRSIILLPWVIPNVVAASIWRWMYHPQFGLLNKLLLSLGISQPILWLAKPTLAFISVMIVFIWKYIPFMVITLLAGLQSISSDYYEVAQINGASRLQSFIYVTFPLLKPVSVTSTLLLAIWAVNHFDIIFVLTGGGPSRATSVLSIEVYNTAFFALNLGKAAAMGVLMLLFLTIFAVYYIRSLVDEQ